MIEAERKKKKRQRRRERKKFVYCFIAHLCTYIVLKKKRRTRLKQLTLFFSVGLRIEHYNCRHHHYHPIVHTDKTLLIYRLRKFLCEIKTTVFVKQYDNLSLVSYTVETYSMTPLCIRIKYHSL